MEIAPLARIKEIYFLVNGVNQILCTVRALMYLKFNSKLSELTDTFATMAGTLLQFLIIWFINLSAFVLMAHCIFGDRIEAWSSFGKAVNQAIGISLGQTDFFSMLEANQIGAILFFFPYVIMQVFVFLNMVIAIILDGYTNMKRERQRMAESWLKDLVSSPSHPHTPALNRCALPSLPCFILSASSLARHPCACQRAPRRHSRLPVMRLLTDERTRADQPKPHDADVPRAAQVSQAARLLPPSLGVPLQND